MRRLASVSLWSENEPGSQALDRLRKIADTWLATKGQVTWADDTKGSISAADGRVLTLDLNTVRTSAGVTTQLTVREPVPGGHFRTEVMWCGGERHVAFCCHLDGGQPPGVVTPGWFDVRLPRLIRDVTHAEIPWKCGSQPIPGSRVKVTGGQGGRDLAARILDANRSLPIIVVSEWDGFVLHPGVDIKIAEDLLGLAEVYSINAEAAWSLTQTMGKDLSCFQGAVRLYWPGPVDATTRLRHPLWTSARLLWGDRTTSEAAKSLRAALRRRVFAASTLALESHALFAEIERAHRLEILETARNAGKEQLETLFDELSEKLSAAEARAQQLVEENRGLQIDVDNLRVQLEAASDAAGDRDEPPVESSPPDSVAAAVERGKRKWPDRLVFGDDVDEAVNSVEADAGPPEKVLLHLEKLAKMAECLAAGPLGNNFGAWLEDQGVAASGEAALTMANKQERQRRTWHDGGSRRVFEWHTKPSDATSPGRCVRIYFDWDPKISKVVVAYVGRKPGV